MTASDALGTTLSRPPLPRLGRNAALRAEDPLLAGGTVDALPRRPFAFIAFLIRRHAPVKVGLMVACAAGAAGLEALGPYVIRNFVNALGTGAGRGWSPEIAFYLVTLGGVWVAASVLFRLFEFVDMHTGPRLRLLAQGYLFSYLLGHSPRYFQDNFAGKLGQKVKQAGQSIVQLLGILAFECTRIIVLLAAGAVLFALERPSFGLILVTWCLVYLLIVQRLARACVRLSKGFSDEVSTSTGRLIDAITNADLIRAFAKAAHEKRFLRLFLAREEDASLRLRTFLIGMRIFMSMAMLGLQLLLIGVAASEVLSGRLTLGGFTLVFFLANMIARSVQELSYRMLDFFEQIGTLAEALELVTEPHEIEDRPGAPALLVREGRIEFEDIHFAHGDGAKVFAGLTLRIAPGEKVGLVGRSGAGKSTLVKLLRRQFEPQQGVIRIDGQPVAEVTWDSLNEAIAEVPQATGIFHRAVRDNIRYARLDAGEDEVVAAARAAHAHDFIMGRPTGYDTIVGEQGIKLSGGERQRVAIARAFVKNARILVLDEATSALDSEAEHHIQAALFELMRGRTVIAIAHRLSTLTGMDRIVVLEQGRIVEEGSHAALLAADGAYARLWRTQVGGFIAA